MKITEENTDTDSKYQYLSLRAFTTQEAIVKLDQSTRPPGRPRRTWLNLVQEDANAVSYTHLTLPTIYSV